MSLKFPDKRPALLLHMEPNNELLAFRHNDQHSHLSKSNIKSTFAAQVRTPWKYIVDLNVYSIKSEQITREGLTSQVNSLQDNSGQKDPLRKLREMITQRRIQLDSFVVH